MRDFSQYDVRKYETASVVEGYGEWSKTYDAKTIIDRIDRPLLERIAHDWKDKEVLDLACGTGRVGAWLRSNGAIVDGIDLTPEMLAQAKSKQIYRRLELGDVTRTGLPAHSYDTVVQVLADEHLQELEPLYAEAARLLRARSRFILIGYHPYFMLNGVPTHFDRPSGAPLAIRQYVHLTSDHVRAARAAGFALEQMEENVVDETWLAEYPRWQKYAGWPISFLLVWSR